MSSAMCSLETDSSRSPYSMSDTELDSPAAIKLQVKEDLTVCTQKQASVMSANELSSSPLLKEQEKILTHTLEDSVLDATKRVSYILTEIVRFNMRKANSAATQNSSKNQESNTSHESFDHSFPPKIMLNDYLERITAQLHLEQDIVVIALFQIDRFIRKQPSFILSPFNCHRILLVSLMIASKMHLDVQLINCPLKLFSRIGGVDEEELFTMESKFLDLINYQLFVQEQDFSSYKLKLLSMKIA